MQNGRLGTMTGRQTSYIVGVARVVLFCVNFALIAPFVPAVREPRFIGLLLWALLYSGLLLGAVRVLGREFLVHWVVASFVLDFGTIAVAQWLGAGAYVQVLYLFAFVFYATSLGLRTSLSLSPVPVVLMLAVDRAAGRLPELLPLDLELAGMILVTAWAVGSLSDERRRLRKGLAHAAMTDGLTGLFNARYFFQRLEQELARAQRTRQPVAVALLDADGFKDVNDTLGHLAGDRVLKACAGALAAAVRASDVPVRYGGDEFALILPEATEAEATEVVRRASAAMSSAAAAELGDRLALHFAFGVADSRLAGDAERLFSVADEQLYRAKPGQRGASSSERPAGSLP